MVKTLQQLTFMMCMGYAKVEMLRLVMMSDGQALCKMGPASA